MATNCRVLHNSVVVKFFLRDLFLPNFKLYAY